MSIPLLERLAPIPDPPQITEERQQEKGMGSSARPYLK